MSILITGGAGFIGSHVCEKLISEGHDLIIIDNLSTGNTSNLPVGVTLYKGDIRDRELFKEIFQNHTISSVIHLAAQTQVSESLKNPLEDAAVNIIGTLNIIDFMIEYDVRKIIFSSSAAVYGNQSILPILEEAPKNIISPYASSKLTTEKYLEMYQRLYGIEYCIFRFSNVFGPRQDISTGGVIAKFLDRVERDKALIVNGNGEQTRDFIYVKDLADAISYSINNLTGTFNLSTGKEISINEVIKQIENEKVVTAVVYSERLQGDIERSQLSNERLINNNWKPSYEFQEALKETINYVHGGNNYEEFCG